MKISTKGKYGLLAMLDLAVNSKHEHVALKNIAERQSISESYLEQVFSTLRKAGLVSSVKGAQGGYFLDKSASEITIGDILRTLEGSLDVINNSSDEAKEHNLFAASIKNKVWDVLNKNISNTVDSISLEDVIGEYKKISSKNSYMYYI